MALITYKHNIFSRHNQSNRSRWYDLNRYHKIRLSYRGYGDDVGVHDYQGCRLWMIEHLSGEVVIDDEKSGSIGNMVFLYFSSDADLLMFKLSEWGEQALEWNDK